MLLFAFVSDIINNDRSAKWGVEMAISYNKLWKILIDKKMNKKDLRLKTGVSTAVIAKMGKGENLTTDILLKVCNALDCDICDIMEIEK